MTCCVIAVLFAVAVLSVTAAEDRMSRHEDNFSLRYGIPENAAQLRRFCKDNPKDPYCRHADPPVELNVIGRTMDGNETILVPNTLLSEIPSLSPSSRLPTLSPTAEFSGSPSSYVSVMPSKIKSSPPIVPSLVPTIIPIPNSSPPSILPSRAPTIFPTTGTPLTESPSRFRSAWPSLEPSLGTSISPSASQTAPPKGLYTSFPSQIPTFSPSSFGSGPSVVPDICTPDPNGDFGVKAKKEVLVEYFYEIQSDPSVFNPVPGDVIFRIERKVAQAVIRLLFETECATMQRIGNDADFAGKRGLQNQFDVVGLSYKPPDMVIPVTCSGIPAIPTTLCSLVEGGITLYLEESFEVTEAQGVAILLEIEKTINSGEIAASEPGILLTIYVSGDIKTSTFDDPTATPNIAPTRAPRDPTQGPTILLPTEGPTVPGKKNFPVYLYVVLIGLLPLFLCAAFFFCSRRKIQRHSHHAVSEDGPGGARGRRRLHLMSIPTRDSEHSLSLPRASASLGPSLSQSDSGSFASLIRIPQGDEELKLRPTTTGSIA